LKTICVNLVKHNPKIAVTDRTLVTGYNQNSLIHQLSVVRVICLQKESKQVLKRRKNGAESFRFRTLKNIRLYAHRRPQKKKKHKLTNHEKYFNHKKRHSTQSVIRT